MNDIYVTLTGNIAAPPRQHTFPDGSRVTSLKVASTSRYFDRENQQWRNGETTYFGVRCFRGLADNVARSVQLGQPIVVQGRLRIREFVHGGERRFMPEVEANSLGHDLRWGIGSFDKPQRGGAAPLLGDDERTELDRETSDWAMSGGAPVPEGAGPLAVVTADHGDRSSPAEAEAAGAETSDVEAVGAATATAPLVGAGTASTGTASGAAESAPSGAGHGVNGGVPEREGTVTARRRAPRGVTAKHPATARETAGAVSVPEETPWPFEERLAA
ncbi:hypothetical protein GCM10010517_66020 [Streptosporangium fragile]|uniref:Single-stranded DNA-binding protein n=1 Tax=Streptosporangium fragile TaxID=46186 RepID=A0ABN3W7K1_9ACTN